MDMDFAVSGPLVRRSRLVPGFCPSTRAFARCFLQTPPRGDSPCTLLALHLHQVGRRTFTSKLLSMPSTPLNRYAIVAAAGSSVSTLTRIEIVDSGAPTWRRKLEGISFCSAIAIAQRTRHDEVHRRASISLTRTVQNSFSRQLEIFDCP